MLGVTAHVGCFAAGQLLVLAGLVNSRWGIVRPSCSLCSGYDHWDLQWFCGGGEYKWCPEGAKLLHPVCQTAWYPLPTVAFEACLCACIPWVLRSGAEQPPHLGEGRFKNLPAGQPVTRGAVTCSHAVCWVSYCNPMVPDSELQSRALCIVLVDPHLQAVDVAVTYVSSSGVCQPRPAGTAVCWNVKNNKVYQACFVISG